VLKPQLAASVARLTQLDAHVAELRARVAQLERLLEQATRGAKRQAAPFSKGPPKPDPKPPGRKPGPDYGTPSFRSAPRARDINETHEAVLPAQCPRCGGRIHQTHVDQQYQVEIPRQPIHRRFNVPVGACTCCGHRVQGRHPLQTSDALGAAASQLGPDLQALLVQLNKDAGLSHGKIQRLLQTLFGIDLSRGGVVQAMQRAARRGASVYHRILQALPRQPAVTPDETGWRIGGHLAWLHAFAAKGLTGYVIDPHRGGDVAEGVLGLDYAGALVHDGWAPYDRFVRAVHQSCLAHLLRRCKELIAAATRGAVRFPRQVKALLQAALALRDRYLAGKVSDHGLAVARGRLEARCNRLLRWIRTHPANERLARHLARHRDQLLTFLYQPGLEATNYRGEQALRPAVVNRKVWGGNRTTAGAQAQSILMSLLRTCTQQHRDPLTFLSRLLRGQYPRLNFAPT
jgi:transposase